MNKNMKRLNPEDLEKVAGGLERARIPWTRSFVIDKSDSETEKENKPLKNNFAHK